MVGRPVGSPVPLETCLDIYSYLIRNVKQPPDAKHDTSSPPFFLVLTLSPSCIYLPRSLASYIILVDKPYDTRPITSRSRIGGLLFLFGKHGILDKVKLFVILLGGPGLLLSHR
jgi:hypothetical protein